jgi:hypothetical protein
MKTKLLIFYGVALCSVVGLFQVVTACGETTLKAPPPIEGMYKISANSLTQCLNNDNLILEIQQSGIYLSGLLLPESKDVPPEIAGNEKPSLLGNFENLRVNLSGNIAQLRPCNVSRVRIDAIWQDNNLKGTLYLNSPSQTINFISAREIPDSQSHPEAAH